MSDLSLEWPAIGSPTGGDWQVDISGDLLTSDGDTETRQRVTRRLLTSPRTVPPDGTAILPPDYIFEPTYGAGLRRMIGSAVSSNNAQTVKQICLDGVTQEDTVAPLPPPDVAVQALGSAGFSVAVSFTSATTGRPVSTPKISLS